MSIEITPDEVSIATRVADKITYRHPGIVDRDDVISELTLWMLRHEDAMRRLRDRGHGLPTALYREAQRYVNKERAQVFGYDPKDQYRYSPAQVQDLLDELTVTGVDRDGVPVLEVPAETGFDANRLKEAGGTASDPAFGGTHLVMLVDVHAGLQSLSPAMNTRLREAVAEGWDRHTLAESWKVSPPAAAQRITRALRKVSDALSEIRADREYTGSREVISNSKARWAIKVGAAAPRARTSPWREGSGVLS